MVQRIPVEVQPYLQQRATIEPAEIGKSTLAVISKEKSAYMVLRKKETIHMPKVALIETVGVIVAIVLTEWARRRR